MLDSSPVALCDDVRLSRCRLAADEEFRGSIASERRYSYGVRVQAVTTEEGVPVGLAFLPGAASPAPHRRLKRQALADIRQHTMRAWARRGRAGRSTLLNTSSPLGHSTVYSSPAPPRVFIGFLLAQH